MSAKPSSGRPEVFSSMSSRMNNRKNVCLTKGKNSFKNTNQQAAHISKFGACAIAYCSRIIAESKILYYVVSCIRKNHISLSSWSLCENLFTVNLTYKGYLPLWVFKNCLDDAFFPIVRIWLMEKYIYETRNPYHKNFLRVLIHNGTY